MSAMRMHHVQEYEGAHAPMAWVYPHAAPHLAMQEPYFDPSPALGQGIEGAPMRERAHRHEPPPPPELDPRHPFSIHPLSNSKKFPHPLPESP